MLNKLWLKIVGIFFLTLFMGLYSAPLQQGQEVLGFEVPSFFVNAKYHLGLDLKGGTQLVYDIDLSDVPVEREGDVINGVEEVIRRRVDGLGVSEPVIQSSTVGAKKHVIVELPGIKDIDQAINTVGKVVQLQFKEKKDSFTEEEKAKIDEKNQEIKNKADELLVTAKETAELSFEKLSNDSREGTYIAPPEELVPIESINPELNTKITEWKDLGVDTLYPDVVDLTNTYSLVNVLEEEDYTENEYQVSHILISFKDAERASADIKRTKEEALIRATKASKRIEAGEDFALISSEYSDDSVAKENGGVLDMPLKESSSPYQEQFTKAVIGMEKGDISKPIITPFGYHIIKVRDITEFVGKKVKIERIDFSKESDIPTGWQDTALTGEHFDFASASFDPNTLAPLVKIQFNSKGIDLFADITERNLNKQLAIFLDDKPIIGESVYAPTVQSKITDGAAVISGLRSLEEASLLAQNLNTGAIPAPITLIGQSTVGATLGHDALYQGLEAGLIGLAILALYMIIYYRVSGLVAVGALVVYSVVLAGTLKLIGVTLTLAGLAGVILSIGMAVDANVLIFERMKEELRTGKDLNISLEEGFKRAWNSIRDSNVSSLITCLILFIFGTGIIRGFALTLAVGVIVSMFSAITITRNFLKVVTYNDALSKRASLFIPFINKSN